MRQRFLDCAAFVFAFLVIGLPLRAHAQTVDHFPHSGPGAISQCTVNWMQSVALDQLGRAPDPNVPNSGDSLAVVNGYTYQFAVDNQTPTTWTGSTPCAASATGQSPFQCSTPAGSVPAAGQTVGAHTLIVKATDRLSQTVSSIAYAYVVDPDPIGPPSPPANVVIRLVASSTSTTMLVPSPLSLSTGRPLTVTWTAPAGHKTSDWIGLFATGSPNTSYVWWAYTPADTTGTMTLTAPAPGTYEFRYLIDNSYQASATSVTVTVTPPGPAER